MDASPTPRRKLLRLPGLDSYRGRYLLLAVILFSVFSIAGLVGYRQVSGVGADNLRSIQQRAQATAALHDALAVLQQLQNRVGRFLFNPPQERPENIRATAEQLRTAVMQLRTTDWVRGTPEVRQVTESAHDSLFLLDSLLDDLIHLRAGRDQWLPATRVIENGINPATMLGQGILAELMEELDKSPPSAENVNQRRIVNDMQLRWMQAIAEVRLLIANRFGVFGGNTLSGMKARADNVQLYLDQFRADLAELEALDAQDRLGLVASARLGGLREISDTFEVSVRAALDQLTDPAWRTDMVLVRDEIEPLIDTLHQRFSSLRLELDIESARNITELTEVSRQLSQFAALLIGVGCLFAVFGYLAFDRILLRPIQQTAVALRQEARGEHATHPPSARGEEIRDLTDAFDEMRRQVRQRQDHLDHLAHHDMLTGLPNRLLFRDRLEHALAVAERNGTMNAVLFLDLDGFKRINDTLGHAAGDGLLRAAADRLRGTIRNSDTIARLGGDEFAILIERVEQRHDVTRLGEKILAALETPFEIDGRRLHISTSIGIALTPVDGEDPGSLTRAADTAMYAAKRAGKGRFSYFTAEMSRQANDYMEMETALRDAIQAQAFRLHLQPIIDVQTGRLHACEILLRWQHPESGPVSPAQFVPILEDMGKLGEVSRWIVDQMDGLQKHLRPLGGHLTLSINLTARLLYDDQFSAFLLERLREDSTLARHLIIEITEDSLGEDLDAATRVLSELKVLGVRIALDDFGTGQSSLNHLRHFPFDLVKIDREFVRDMPEDPHDVSLVKAVIELSHAFGMRVVAEGVETAQQEAMLRELGCDCLQGYLISRPMTPEALGDFMTEYPPAASLPGQSA